MPGTEQFWAAAFDDCDRQVIAWTPYDPRAGGTLTLGRVFGRVHVAMVRVIRMGALLYDGEPRRGGVTLDPGDTLTIPGARLSPS